MNCPVCDGETFVYDSRPKQDSTNRRRKCLSCGYKFTTVEIDRDFYKNLIKDKNQLFSDLSGDVKKVVEETVEQFKARLYGAYGLQNGG